MSATSKDVVELKMFIQSLHNQCKESSWYEVYDNPQDFPDENNKDYDADSRRRLELLNKASLQKHPRLKLKICQTFPSQRTIPSKQYNENLIIVILPFT